MSNIKDLPIEQLLSRYIDGELTEQEKYDVQKMLENDSETREKYEELMVVNTAIIRAVDEINEHPLPESVTHLLNQSEPSRKWMDIISDYLQTLTAFKPAVAVALTIAVIAPLLINIYNIEPEPIFVTGDIKPGTKLGKLLDTSISGETFKSGDTELVSLYSFRTVSNEICRELTGKRKQTSERAVACNSGNSHWEIILTTSIPLVAENKNFITASGENSNLINDFIDQNISGEILTLAEEQKEIASKWR